MVDGWTSSRITLIVMIIVAILIIIEAGWSLQLINSTAGDSCACSGVTDSQLAGMRAFEIIMLLIGIAIAAYAAIMLLMPPKSLAVTSAGERIRERFNRVSV